MTIAVQDFLDKIRLDLVDEDAVTWTEPDLLEDLNESIRALLQVKPDAYAITDAIPLVAGTIQSLPTDGAELFDLIENVASLRRVTIVDLELLDEVSRFWPAGTRATDVKHYCYDPRDKTQFRVYPPNDGGGSVIGSYAAIPSPCSFSDVLPVSDKYEPVLVARTLAAAYRRNTQRQDLSKTQGYLQQFLTLLGLGSQAENAAAAKVNGGA